MACAAWWPRSHRNCCVPPPDAPGDRNAQGEGDLFPLPFLSLQAAVGRQIVLGRIRLNFAAILPKALGSAQSVHLISCVKCNVSCILSEWIALFSILREHRREELGMGKGFGDSAAFAPELCAGGPVSIRWGSIDRAPIAIGGSPLFGTEECK